VTRQISEKIAPKIAGHRNEGIIRNPPGNSPEQTVTHDQRNQKREGIPDLVTSGRMEGQCINQIFNTVLRADRGSDRANDRGQDAGMGHKVAANVKETEGPWPLHILRQILHWPEAPLLALVIISSSEIAVGKGGNLTVSSKILVTGGVAFISEKSQ
jgi:hypothetical protein